MKLFAITFRPTHTIENDYRVLCYSPFFQENGIDISCAHGRTLSWKHLKQMRDADVVLNQKTLLPIRWGILIRALSKRLVYDWDDALWTRPGKPYSWWTQQKINARLHWWLKNADTVLCPNDYLANYTRKFNKNVVIVPMSLNLEVFKRKTPRANDGQFVLGWTGAPGNLPFLKVMEEPVGRFLQKYPQAKLKILGEKKPDLKIPFEHVRWESADTQNDFVDSIDVGLLPLPANDPYIPGKSPIKSLFYMSRGIPVVGNMGEGGGAEIAKNGGCLSVKTSQEWFEALESLLNKEFYLKKSQEALANVRQHHDIKKVFFTWKEALGPSA